jgi:YD repeat-containing protein
MTQAVGTSDETAITYDYDDVSRLTGITYSDVTVEYAYDGAGNRTVMTDTLGTTTYTYDLLYRLQAVKDPFDERVGYGYNAVGNRDDLVYPTDDTVTQTFDALNRLAQVEDWDGGVTAYGYDEAGLLVTATLRPGSGQALPNGVETAFSYDDANRLTQIEHSTSGGELLARYVYELDQVGNRVQATETISTPGSGLITTTITYTYDGLYRLTEADYSSGENFQYTYDAVGNRTIYTATVGSTSVMTYSYDAANPVEAGRPAALPTPGVWIILGMI